MSDDYLYVRNLRLKEQLKLVNYALVESLCKPDLSNKDKVVLFSKLTLITRFLDDIQSYNNGKYELFEINLYLNRQKKMFDVELSVFNGLEILTLNMSDFKNAKSDKVLCYSLIRGDMSKNKLYYSKGYIKEFVSPGTLSSVFLVFNFLNEHRKRYLKILGEYKSEYSHGMPLYHTNAFEPYPINTFKVIGDNVLFTKCFAMMPILIDRKEISNNIRLPVKVSRSQKL